MEISTLKDLQDNIELLKQRELTYYDGNWYCFRTDSNGCGSCDTTIKLNNRLFNVLKDCEYLIENGHTISHRAVTQFRFAEGTGYCPDIMCDIDSLVLELMPLFKDKKFKSISNILDYLKEQGYKYQWNDYHYDFGSYWSGDRYCSIIRIDKGNISVGFPYSSCNRTQLFKKNNIYRTLIRYHRILNGYSWLNYKDCPNESIKGGSGTGRRLLGTKIIEDFWKESVKLNPYSDESLDELVDKKKELLSKI